VFGSILLGFAVAAATALLTKFARIKDYPLLETSLFALMSYSSYLLAEILEMSGIVSVLFCGICQVSFIRDATNDYGNYSTLVYSILHRLWTPRKMLDELGRSLSSRNETTNTYMLKSEQTWPSHKR
jgi:NhaP-type Na+/H+ or K+/H+ antiporter